MPPNPFSLNGKTILITGASSGIGRQCAVTCSSQGARVILLGRDRNRLDETMEMLNNRDLHYSVSADLTNFELIEEVINDIVARFGKISGLVNSAGISTTLPFSQAKPEKIEEYFRTNVQAAFNLTRIVVKTQNFKEEGGSVIFISSVMGEAGEVGKTIYSITKGALIAGSRSLALELAPKKIRVNCISPGVVVTPMSKSAVYSRNEESLARVKALHPLGLGQPEDIAWACVYLLSDESRWITGTNLIVDGGYLAR